MSALRTEYNTLVTVFLLKTKESIKQLKTRLHAIQKLKPLKTAKHCKPFAGVVNCLSMFCPNLQKHLKPIHDMIRKERPFIWTKIHQYAFEVITNGLLKFPVLHLPDNRVR